MEKLNELELDQIAGGAASANSTYTYEEALKWAEEYEKCANQNNQNPIDTKRIIQGVLAAAKKTLKQSN